MERTVYRRSLYFAVFNLEAYDLDYSIKMIEGAM
jgi:hypothetical protein